MKIYHNTLMSNKQEEQKKVIKNWLKEEKKDREWLASKCLVSKTAIDQWFKKVGKIPEAKLSLIESLMQVPIPSPADKKELATLPDIDERGKMFLHLSEKGQQDVYREAMRLNLDPSTYCTMAVEWCCEQEDIGERIAARLAAKREREKEAQFKAPVFTPPVQEPPYPYGSEIAGEVIGEIAAGSLEAGDTVPSDIQLHRELEKDEYILRVNGKSMEPDIADGALVIMRKYTSSQMPKVGTIVEYNDGRGVTLKRLSILRSSRMTEYVLESINPAYPDIIPMDGGKISAVYVETIKADEPKMIYDEEKDVITAATGGNEQEQKMLEAEVKRMISDMVAPKNRRGAAPNRTTPKNLKNGGPGAHP